MEPINYELAKRFYDREAYIKTKHSAGVVDIDSVLEDLYRPAEDIEPSEIPAEAKEALTKILSSNSNNLWDVCKNFAIPVTTLANYSSQLDEVKSAYTTTTTIPPIKWAKDIARSISASHQTRKADKANSNWERRKNTFREDLTKLKELVEIYDPNTASSKDKKRIREATENLKDNSAPYLGKHRYFNDKSLSRDPKVREEVADTTTKIREDLGVLKDKMTEKGLEEEAKIIEKVSEMIANMIKAFIDLMSRLFSVLTGGKIAPAKLGKYSILPASKMTKTPTSAPTTGVITPTAGARPGLSTAGSAPKGILVPTP